MGGSVRKNYLYNLIYQVTAVILPLITMPYVARRLGVEGVGINSYTNANMQYFILLGSLGVSTYATKHIATVREKADKLKKNFWEIFLIQFIGCFLAYLIFILLLGTRKGLGYYYFLQGFFILGTAFDISWYFLGVENFKNASIRNLMVKIISVVLIFVFIKSSDDLGKYIFINSFTTFLGQIIMWAYVDKEVLRFKELKKVNIVRHIRPVIALFIPQMATQVYMVLDKTMTGKLANTVQVGYYDQSQKIIRVLLAVVTSLGTVMLPRIANLHSKDAHDEIKLYLRKAFSVISFLVIPISLGIMGVSERFIPLFFGEEYMSVIPLTMLSSIMIIIIGLGNVFGTQYMLATGKNSEYTISVCVGAVVNFSLNLILIPKFYALGAVIATVTAEFSIALIQFWYSRKIFDFSWIKETYKYWVSGILMLCVVNVIGQSNGKNLLILAIQVVCGGIVYFATLLLLKDKLLLNSIKTVSSKLKK